MLTIQVDLIHVRIKFPKWAHDQVYHWHCCDVMAYLEYNLKHQSALAMLVTKFQSFLAPATQGWY